jgi:hypothetical protein
MCGEVVDRAGQGIYAYDIKILGGGRLLGSATANQVRELPVAVKEL